MLSFLENNSWARVDKPIPVSPIKKQSNGGAVRKSPAFNSVGIPVHQNICSRS